VSGKYAFIDAETARYPIVKMCIWLDVSTSGYYEWVDRLPSATAQGRTRLAALVQAMFDESDGTYGYRRVHAALARQDEDCGPELVRDIMRELGLVPCQPRPWRPTTTQAGEGAEAVPDLVGRDFSADMPGTKVVGDVTYLPTWQGFAYLATVIDCCTKECIGYAIADHMRAELVIDALRMAARNYCLEPEASGSTSASNAGTSPGSWVAALLRPPPLRRARSGGKGSSPPSSSNTPLRTVVTLTPATSATARTPP
jgi:putative transposase